MPKTTTKKAGARRAPAKSSGGGKIAVKISDRSYRTLQRLAKAEQRTIIAVIDRAVEHYRATAERGGS